MLIIVVKIANVASRLLRDRQVSGLIGASL